MKSLLSLLISLTVFIPTSQATDFPCVAVESYILNTALSNNQGCEGYEELCSQFSKCMRQHLICVVSKGKVFDGGTAKDLRTNDRSIGFGVNQTFETENRRYCVLAAMYSFEEESTWHYETFTPNTGAVPVKEPGGEGGPLNYSEFLINSTQHFNASMLWLRDYLKKWEIDCPTCDFGYKKGEEP